GKLPVWILGSTDIVSAPGYVLNPIDIVVNFIENTTLEHLAPSRIVERTSLPLVNFPVIAQSLYGYKLVSTSPVIINDSRTIIPGLVPTITVDFYYEPLSPSELAKYAGIVLKQGAPRPHGRIGSDLRTTVNLSNSDVSGDGYDLPPGTMIEIYYDATRVNRNTIRVSIEDSFYDIDTSQDGKVVLTLFNGFTVGSDIEISIIWNLLLGPTEEGVEFPLYAHLVMPDSTAPDGLTPVAQANVVSLSGYYLRPGIIKYANGEALDYRLVGFGFVNPDGSYMTDDTKSVVYTYGLYNLERNLTEFTLIDYLPEYKTIDQDGIIGTAKASFDPVKNPGWTLIDPVAGVVSYTMPVNNTRSFALPKLILDFPDLLANQMVENTVGFIATPYDMAPSEDVFTGEDSIISWFDGVEAPLGMFSKHPLRPFFYDYYQEKTREFRWRLTVAAFDVVTDEVTGIERLVPFPEGYYLENVTLADDDLDNRMRFVGVDLADFGPARVTAFDASGTVLFDAHNQLGELRFPTSIRDAIDRIEINESKLRIPTGTSAYAYVITELRDPNIRIEDFSDDPTAERDVGLRFPNTGHFTADLFNKQNEYQSSAAGPFTRAVRMQPFEAGLGISKSIIGGSTGRILRAGDQLSYSLNLDLYNAETLTRVKSEIPDDDITVADVVIYDVIPIDYIVDGVNPFTPSRALLMYSTNLRWSILPRAFEDSDGWHDVLKIEADTLSPFLLTRESFDGNIGVLRGTISTLAYDDQQLINHTYLDFVEDDFVYAGQTSDYNPYLGPTENPFSKTVLWSHAAVDVVASKVFAMQKEIRALDSDSPDGYGFWSNKGIKTPAGEEFQYRLRLRNNTEEDLYRTDVAVIDVFPYVGDVGIARTDQYRFSQFENTYDGAGSIKVYLDGVLLTSGITIQYLLTPLPYNYSTFTITQVNAYLDDSANWHLSYSDASDVKGIRVDLGSVEIHPGQEVEIIVDMIANNDLTNVGERAYNSFVRKDNVQTSYIEAPRVYNEIPDKLAEIRMRKSDLYGMNYLNDAVFGIYEDDGSPFGRLVQVQTTAANPALGTGDGWIRFSDIERGDYFIQEITPPDGYQLNTTRYPVYFIDFIDPDPSSNTIPYIANKYSNVVIPGVNGNPSIPAGTPIPNTPEPTFGSIVLHKVDGTGS
ncbi:MAG: prealbumin-like fold domain-containing protein, partial [Coriobacteriia bacterium]|nr:prealbumin-like fold domain-containing protein [Coriobacteriia bacterium]